jgi:hypothetical protein
MEGGDRRRDLEHQERERSKMHWRIEGGEGRVVGLTEGAAMAMAALNLTVVAVLRQPVVDER